MGGWGDCPLNLIGISVEEIGEGYLRIAIPLPSGAHQGCAECHFAEVEGTGADTSRNIVMGTLNAYIPLSAAQSKARSAEAISQGNLGATIDVAGKDDVLGHSIVAMVESFKSVDQALSGLTRNARGECGRVRQCSPGTLQPGARNAEPGRRIQLVRERAIEACGTFCEDATG